MLLSLMVAVAVLSQGHPEVDKDYEPKVGDRALLGRVSSKNPEGEINWTSTFSSIEKVKEYLDSHEPEAGLNADPDGYIVRAGTPVIVKGEGSVRITTSDGSPVTIYIARIEICDGEFKDRILFTPRWNVFRFLGQRAASATKRKKGATGTEAPKIGPGTKLVLTDLVIVDALGGSYVKIDARVKCVFQNGVKGITGTFLFEDAEGKLVSSAPAFCIPTDLENGDSGTLSTFLERSPRVTKIRMNFIEGNTAIRWADESGKEAHP